MPDAYLDYIEKPNRKRFARLVIDYLDPVSRLVRRVAGDNEHSDDIIQEVFVRLAESGKKRRDANAVLSPKAYVLQAALYAAREHARRERTRLHHEREAGKRKVKTAPSVEEEAIAKEAVEGLYSAIDSLPEPLRVAAPHVVPFVLSSRCTRSNNFFVTIAEWSPGKTSSPSFCLPTYKTLVNKVFKVVLFQAPPSQARPAFVVHDFCVQARRLSS